MNFLLRHEPVLTDDIDFWIRDTAANLARCDAALQQLDAAWGPTEQDWRPVAAQPGWLGLQEVFCLTSSSGAIDIFRTVKGLPSWADCKARAHAGRTAAGVPYRGLCDEDVLACPMALPPQTSGETESTPSDGPSTATAARMIRPREHACERTVADGCRRPRATRARPARAGLVPGGPLAGAPGDDPVGRGAGERPPQHARGLHRTGTTQAVIRTIEAG